MTSPPKHRLRWYQYSLRSLFVLTVLVAIAGSWFAIRRQQVARERAAVAWIREMGGSAEYDWQLDASRDKIPNAEPPGPEWLRDWLGDDFFAHVVYVRFNGETVMDADLKRLEDMSVKARQPSFGERDAKSRTYIRTRHVLTIDPSERRGEKKMGEKNIGSNLLSPGTV